MSIGIRAFFFIFVGSPKRRMRDIILMQSGLIITIGLTN